MKLPSNITDNDFSTSKKSAKKNRFQTFLKFFGLAIGVSLIAWFIKKSDPMVIWAQLQHIGVNFMYLLLVTFVAYLLVSIAWQQSFLNSPSNINTSQFFIIRLIGESLAQINPTNVIAGETLKAFLLRKKGVPYKDSIVSLTISRFLIILSSVALILIGIYLFFDMIHVIASTSVVVGVIGGIFLVLLGLLYLLHSGKGLFYYIISFANRYFAKSEKVQASVEKLTEIDRELVEFYKTKKWNFFSAFMLSFLHRIVGAMEFFVILYFLGIDVSIVSCIVMEMGVAVFKALGSFVPGQIGVEEFGNKVMLEFIHVPGASELWITVSILKRARQLFWIGAGVIAFSIFMKINNENTTEFKEISDGSIVYHA